MKIERESKGWMSVKIAWKREITGMHQIAGYIWDVRRSNICWDSETIKSKEVWRPSFWLESSWPDNNHLLSLRALHLYPLHLFNFLASNKFKFDWSDEDINLKSSVYIFNIYMLGFVWIQLESIWKNHVLQNFHISG